MRATLMRTLVSKFKKNYLARVMRDADAGLGLAPRMESDGLLALNPPSRGVSPPSDIYRESLLTEDIQLIYRN
jgi:hypothetical protein